MMLKGITIKLYTRTQTDTDAFNRPVYTETVEEVENVLVYPGADAAILTTQDLSSAQVDYTMAIPKVDTHDWRNVEVEFFGTRFKTYGLPAKGIDAMIPLGWNEKVMVKHVE